MFKLFKQIVVFIKAAKVFTMLKTSFYYFFDEDKENMIIILINHKIVRLVKSIRYIKRKNSFYSETRVQTIDIKLFSRLNILEKNSTMPIH